eukprot:CAMPEP_0119403454 /NCGR_PEP_ID=MMETSP1334-20130426/143393_1 /TAXON_ID=127549 /ORGANISM="Calcidiscus leptoporus, Strain RCC1130" /LENGTH=216 /DNA_ID=CAMNT_0007427399 /DNA_START=511 /DNA_END=1158 /DNA_ORIENTATION=-
MFFATVKSAGAPRLAVKSAGAPRLAAAPRQDADEFARLIHQRAAQRPRDPRLPLGAHPQVLKRLVLVEGAAVDHADARLPLEREGQGDVLAAVGLFVGVAQQILKAGAQESLHTPQRADREPIACAARRMAQGRGGGPARRHAEVERLRRRDNGVELPEKAQQHVRQHHCVGVHLKEEALLALCEELQSIAHHLQHLPPRKPALALARARAAAATA